MKDSTETKEFGINLQQEKLLFFLFTSSVKPSWKSASEFM